MGQHVKAVLFSRDGFPNLLTPNEAAELCHVSETRLMELAKCGFAPCVIIDNQKILFFKKDILEWTKEHLVSIQDGTKLSIEVRESMSLRADPFEIPESLSAISKKLKTATAPGLGACIYFLIEKNEVVYVGQSVNLMGRLGQHVGEKPFDRVLYLHIPQEALIDVETSLIKFLKPKLNRAQNTGEEMDAWHAKNLRRIGLLSKDEGKDNVSSKEA